ncbi:MAG: stage II sporulation protein P [Romboutsia sp.]
MLRNRIKAISVACMLICILPTLSYAIDKDEFGKFLINSSYPESKTEKNKDARKDDSKTSKVETEDKSNNKEVNKGQYIKVHVGEENIPDINQDKETQKESQVVSANNSEYKNDIRITKENPEILLYHTHSSETYAESPTGNYHSQDKSNSVMAVGSSLTDELGKKGWGVLHTTKYNDIDYNASYATSLKSIQDLKSKNQSMDIAIDLHRDARNITDSAVKKREYDKFTTTVNGEKVSKFFFVVGAKNENLNELKAMAEGITKLAESKYPGITMPVLVKPYGKYNQFVIKNHMLVEIGSNASSIKEAKATTKYLANVLDEYFKDYK